MNSIKIFLIFLAFIGLVIDLAVVSVLVLPIQPRFIPMETVELTPTIELTLYMGELPGGKLGFGLSQDEITSPGPVIRVRVGDVVKITVINIGDMPHSFAIVPSLSDSPQILFNSATPVIQPGESESIVFRVDRVGSFYYQCTVIGHWELGMYGEFIIEE